MLDGLLAEDVAHGQAGMAGTNDDNVNGSGRAAGDVAQTAHWLIRTLTLVGFVMMSNTAERFCDWATTRSMRTRRKTISQL